MAEEGSPTAWYECTRCGACCRWAGDVCIEEDEVREIALFLEMDEQAFINECCRLRANSKGWRELCRAREVNQTAGPR